MQDNKVTPIEQSSGKPILGGLGNFLKDLPDKAYGDPGEAAKAAGKISESVAGCASEEERSFRAEDKATADFYQECLRKAETPEERATIREEFAKVRERARDAWQETRVGRAKAIRGAARVTQIVALGVAGLITTAGILYARNKFES